MSLDERNTRTLEYIPANDGFNSAPALAQPANILRVNLVGPLGTLSVEIEAPDIDHVWTFMKNNGYVDCIMHDTGGKRARIAVDVVKAIVERDSANIVKVPVAPHSIIHPGIRRQ